MVARAIAGAVSRGMTETVPDGFVPRVVGGGFMAPFGPLFVRRGEGGSTFGLRIEPRHCNGMDMAHGGMLTTLADLVLGIGGFEAAGVEGFFITVSLQADFLAPVPLGAWVEARAELLRRTRTLLFVQGTFTAQGRAVLRASGIFALPKGLTAG